MFELVGLSSIASVLVGSVLLALFAGEALITWTIRAMNSGRRRAEERRTGQQESSSGAKLLAGQRPRLQRI
jgi:hypothetical protein